MADYTLTYSELTQGFPSFYSYIPDWMIGMNNHFYTFKGGNLYKHNEGVYNNYYGIQYGSSVTSVFNDAVLENKIFTDGLDPFILNTGATNSNFVVAIPSTLNLTEVLDIDSLNMNITNSYVVNTFDVLDFIGTNVSYDVYTMTNTIPYSSNHRHQVKRT